MLPIVAFYNCSNEETRENTSIHYGNELDVCEATIEGLPTEELKSYVVRNGVDYSMSWKLGDQFVAHHESLSGTCTSTSSGKTAVCDATYERQLYKGTEQPRKISGFLLEPTPEHIVYAYYPAKYCKQYLGNGRFKVTMPGMVDPELNLEQIYVSPDSICSDLYPMACVTDSKTFSFKNVAGVFHVKLVAKEPGLIVKSVSISSSEINMSGDAVVSIDKNTKIPTLVMDPVVGDPLPVKMVFKKEVEISTDGNKPTDALFVIPPYKFSKNSMTISVETQKGICTYNISSGFDIPRNSSWAFKKNLLLTLSAGGTGIEGDFAD